MSNNRQIYILLTLLAAMGCTPKNNKTKLPPLKVEVAEVRSESLSDKISFSSQIESLYEVKIEPRVNGYLTSMPFEIGEPIKKGAVIFTIDPSQISTSYYSAQANLSSAEAQRVKAENDYNRAVPLSRINAISQSEKDEYQAALAAADASLRAAKESLRNAELNVNYTTIKAPIDGIIALSSAKEGDYVGPGTLFSELTTISYIDTVVIDLAIPTHTYLKQHAIQPDERDLLSNITIELDKGEIYPYPAEYYYTKRDASAGSSTVVIATKVYNPNRILKPGMFARVHSSIGKEREQIVVPQLAVSQMQGVSSVWVIAPDSSVSFRKVELGAKHGSDWIVTSGLTAGERVLTTAQIKMRDGMKVSPIDTIAMRRNFADTTKLSSVTYRKYAPFRALSAIYEISSTYQRSLNGCKTYVLHRSTINTK